MDTEVLRITAIQRFCMKDGPGIRTVIFLKGCPLRCAWCHNPETQKEAKELLFTAQKCIGCGQCASVCSQNVHLLTEEHALCRDACITCAACVNVCPTGALTMSGAEFTVQALLDEILKDRAFYSNGGGITLSGGEPFSAGHTIIDLLKECKAHSISTAIETCGYGNTSLFEEVLPYTDLFL